MSMCAPWLLLVRSNEMMMNTTLAQLRTLKLDGVPAGLEEQLVQLRMGALSFEELGVVDTSRSPRPR